MAKKTKYFNIVREILPFLWEREEKVRFLFLISIFLIFITIGLNLSIPIILKNIIKNISLSDTKLSYQLSLLLVAYGLIWTLSQIIQQVRTMIIAKPLEKCLRIFCSKLFNHLHSLPMKFHLDRKTGSITNALERAQNGFPDIFCGLFLFIIPIFLELILAATILCYYYGAVYGFILFTVVAAFTVLTWHATKRASYFQTLSNVQQLNTNAFVVDSLLNFASVKHFNNKNYENLKCDIHLKERERVLIKMIYSMECVRISQNIIIGIGIILLTYIAGKQTLKGVHDISDFVLINGYILQFAIPLSQIGFIARNIRKSMNDFSNILEIYNTEPAESPIDQEKYYVDQLKSIEFKNVSFGYDPSQLILKNISFDIKAGKTIGIVGETGSGKSTISSLIFKFFTPNLGKIFINNIDIQKLETKYLYNLLGIVPQDITLFNTTIYENILFAKPNAKKEEVEIAIKLAQLESVLERLPYHYDTIVGERGLKLSGGEKQRIAIARALLKKPSLYIFDEATSSLDLTTEKIIMDNISPLMKNSTCIIIAHRLTTVVNSDEILVFHNGYIEERGTHLSLLAKKGRYASLWKDYEETQNLIHH